MQTFFNQKMMNNKGMSLIVLIIIMLGIALIGGGVAAVMSSKQKSYPFALNSFKAYEIANAGAEFAIRYHGDNPTLPLPTTAISFGGGSFTLTDNIVASNQVISQGTYRNITRRVQVANFSIYATAIPGGPTISFFGDMGDLPQPGVGWGMNKIGAVTVDYTNKQILLGDGTAGTTDSFGSVVYGGGSYLGNCSDGICDFGSGIRAYFEFTFFPEDSSLDSRLSADGFTFAIFNGTNNLITATGGPPPDVASLGELVGYAGPGTHVGTEGPGWQPPKLAIEFDSYPNTGGFSITAPLSRRDPNTFHDHMALILWGENSAAPYRPDATMANAVGLRCAPNDEFIRSLYRSILGRYAELGELQDRTNVLNGQTTTVAQNVARSSYFGSFFGSGGYIGKNTSDVQYVYDLSKAVLGGSAISSNTIGYGTFCANEGGSCAFTGRKIVRYGAAGSYFYKYDQPSPVACTNANFGDPIPGTAKQCYTLDRTESLNAVLASTAYTNNVNSCGTYAYDATANMGTYNCGGVSRVSTSLDCSGLPLSLYNRDTLDDNVHSEGLTESSFTALPLSPRNSDRTADSGPGYYEGPDRTCKSSGNTCRWFEDGYLHAVRIEVLRDTAAHTCSLDYTGNTVPPATPGTGNCYNYQVKAWVDCDGSNPTGCNATQITNMKIVTVGFTGTTPQIDRTIELPESVHTKFNKMIFGWTGATGQPVGGTGQKVTLSNFEMSFRTPQPCPAVTIITPASLPGGTSGTAYSQTLAAEATSAKPFTWVISFGSLPTGLSLSSAGVISGTPSAGGTYNFTVRATNVCGTYLDKAYSIVVAGPSCSGGTITTSLGKWIHTFTSSSTLICPVALTADVLVVGGGGGAGRGTINTNRNAGGGAAGGLIYKAGHPITAQTYTVTVGAGGAGSSAVGTRGDNGLNSTFDALTAIGGGGGGSTNAGVRTGSNGGSGGGATRYGTTYSSGGTGTQTAQSGDSGIYGFGTNGATSTSSGAGGGGGAGAGGTVTTGGAGKTYWGTTYATGGNAQSNAAAGAPNTGNGGNAAATNSGSNGGNGGSGIVIIRY